MSKMILLELTEKEAELIQRTVLALKDSERDRQTEDPTDYDRRIAQCKSILSKTEKALMTQISEIIGATDLFRIVSMAKDMYVLLPSEPYIENKKVEEVDFKHIALVKATVMWLNGKSLLKRLADFEFTDHGYQYEENE
jgi:hypothetical protein